MRTSTLATLLPLSTLSFVPNMYRRHVRISTNLGVLFPNKKGIVVESVGDFVARDPLIDDFMGRRSSANDVLRNDNVPRGERKNLQPIEDAATEYGDLNNMSIREIQLELEQRNIFYGDCFDEESLMRRVREARGENVWEENHSIDGQMYQESYLDMEQNNFGREGQNEFLYDQRYNEVERFNEEALFDAQFNNSEGWVYMNPVPPNTPPPEYPAL